jgi:predicted deacylase
VNSPAFWGHAAHVVPLDGKNPSRTYPGRRDGTVAEVMAAHLFDEVFSHCDALIDLHSGDIMLRLTPFTIYQGSPDAALEERGHALAASYGFPVAVRRPNEVLTRPVPGYLGAAATLRGIPAITAECGGEATMREADVVAHVAGLRSALAHLGVLRGTPAPSQPRTVEFAFVLAPDDGVFTWNIDVGDRFRADQVLGAMRDDWGRTVTELRAPADGEILFFSTSLAARKGDILFGMGVPFSRA